MRIVGIGGEPASGKTTFVRALMATFGERVDFKFKSLRGYWYGKAGVDGIFVLGVYEDGETFAGTDRLSMAVQPDVKDFLKTVDVGYSKDVAILFEGDRLFNASLLEYIDARIVAAKRWYVLQASDEKLAERRAARGNKQPERFLASRRTKIKNILSSDAHRVYVQPNDTPAQAEETRKLILDFLNGATT